MHRGFVSMPASRALLVAGLLGAALTPAHAQSGESFIGLTLGGQSAVVRDADAQPLVLPAFRYGRFFLEGGVLGIDLVEGGGPRLFAGLLITNDGFEADDTPALAGLEDRDPRVYAAIGASYRTPYGVFLARLAGEVSNQSGGTRARLGYQLPIQFDALTLVPGAGIDLYNAKDASYLYGVSAAEARPDRAAYAPGGGINPYLGFSAAYRLGGPHAVNGFVQVSALDKAFRDSPIVGERVQTTLGVGYQYRF